MKIMISRPVHRLTILCVAILAILFPAIIHAQFAFDECSDTEAWTPVGEGLPGVVAAMAEMGGMLYAVHSIPGDDSAKALSRFDGAQWTQISTFELSRGDFISDLVAYRDSLYLSGIFDSLDHLPNTSGLAMWNGSRWRAVEGITPNNFRAGIPGPPIGRSLKMAVYKEKLFVSGAFLDDAANRFHGIVTYNDTIWETIAKAPQAATDSLYVTSFAEWRGDLYVGGYFSRIGGVEAHGVARWDGSAWSRVGTSEMRATQALVVHDDRLYTFRDGLALYSTPGDEYVARWDGASWEQVPSIIPRQRVNETRWFESLSAVSFRGSLYYLTSGSISKGTVSSYQLLAARWDGAKAHHLARPNAAGLLRVFKNDLYAGGSFEASCGAQLLRVAKLCDSANCIGISGRVTVDSTGDCEREVGRRGVAGSLIEVTPGPRYIPTDSNGYYRFATAPGSYTLRSIAPRYHQQNCPVTITRDVVIAQHDDRSVGNNFSHAPIPGIRDLEISIAGDRIRPGRPVRYTIACTNRGTIDLPVAMVALIFDERLRVDSTWPARSWSGKGIAQWMLQNMTVGETRSIELWLTASQSLQLGMMVCAHAVVDSTGDVSLAGNVDDYCTKVVASYDPNDIAVHPAGYGDGGTISERDSILTYTIRFQNIGNDTAFRVVVIDTLSRHLDLTTIALGATSHPFALKLGERGAMIWVFDDIGLPAMGMNESRSQGYLKYSVRVKRGLPPSTQITNRANIYFDYNRPVATNTVKSTTPQPSSVPVVASDASDVMLYPNPTRGVMRLRGGVVKGSTIRVENLLGEMVRSLRAEDGGEETAIDLSGLPAGRYVVVLESLQGRIVRQVALVR